MDRGRLSCSLLAVLFSAGSARASEWRPYVFGETEYQADTFATAEYTAYGAGGGLKLGSELDVSIGARLLLGELREPPALSGFVQASLGVRHGAWQPSMGFELEAVSELTPEPKHAEIAGSFTRRVEAEERPRWRGGLVAAPLRAELAGSNFVVAALKLSTPLDGEAGRRVYVGLTLVRVTWPL
jgi:hypothetical protein